VRNLVQLLEKESLSCDTHPPGVWRETREELSTAPKNILILFKKDCNDLISKIL
jgi:hypothetical protein